MRRHRYRYAVVSKSPPGRRRERLRSKCLDCGAERMRVASVDAHYQPLALFDLFRTGPGQAWTDEPLRCVEAPVPT